MYVVYSIRYNLGNFSYTVVHHDPRARNLDCHKPRYMTMVVPLLSPLQLRVSQSTVCSGKRVIVSKNRSACTLPFRLARRTHPTR